MSKVVYVKSPVRELLQKEFRVSGATISDALNFKRSNQRAAMIRSTAINTYKGIFIRT